MKRLRVLLIDDHPVLRQGLWQILGAEPGLEVVGAVGDSQAALAAADELRPDIVLCDINLPGMNGLELARVLRRRMPRCGIIMLTVHNEDAQILAAAKAGADAFVNKEAGPVQVVEVIRRVAGGEHVIQNQIRARPDLIARLSAQLQGKAPTVPDGPSFSPLTARELEILDCMARGMSNKEMAAQLSISEQTIKNHVTNLLRKLEVSDRTQAVLHAVKQGWIVIGSPAAPKGEY
jgi:DNA-binding NarL/FixJ family response regulator